MQCPQCGYMLDDLDPVCPRCHAEDEKHHDEAFLFLTQRTGAGAKAAREALEATGWNLRQAFARLGATPPPGPLPGERPAGQAGGAPPPPAGPPRIGATPPPIASDAEAKPKGFGTPGTRASKAITGVLIAVGALVLVGVVFLCLGLFGVAGPIRKGKTVQAPPAGTQPEVTMTADALWEEYSTNKAQGQSKYGGKFARLSGTVSGVETGKSGRVTALIGADPVTGCKCSFAEGQGKSLQRGQDVTVEGMVDDFTVHVLVKDCRVVSATPAPASGGAEAIDPGAFGGGGSLDE